MSLNLTPFRFPDEIREHVRALAELCRYANSREDGRWANQSRDPDRQGVYGHAHEAILAICRECLEEDAFKHLYIEFGCCRSWLEDVELACSNAIQELADSQELWADAAARARGPNGLGIES